MKSTSLVLGALGIVVIALAAFSRGPTAEVRPGAVALADEQRAEKEAKADAEETDRAADRAAIHEVRRSFAAAFHKGDAAAAAAFLTSGAELIPDEGRPVHGRDKIQKAFADYFAKRSKMKISLDSESLRFLSENMAVEEGQMHVTPEKGPAETNRYNILYARENGKWLLAAIREWDSEEAKLRDLDWLIGKWSTKDGEVESVYEWLGNKTFIRAQFSIRAKDRTFSAMQIIGTDPHSGELRTWTFERNGGVGEGTCTREGKKWLFEGSTSMPDGGILTAQNILVQVDKDTFTWQPVNLNVNGEEIKDMPPVKVTRVKDKN
jgi:uncharacterized protein (TIGR02246 family)